MNRASGSPFTWEWARRKVAWSLLWFCYGRCFPVELLTREVSGNQGISLIPRWKWVQQSISKQVRRNRQGEREERREKGRERKKGRDGGRKEGTCWCFSNIKSGTLQNWAYFIKRHCPLGKEVKFLSPISEMIKLRPMPHLQVTVEVRTEPASLFLISTRPCPAITLALLAALSVASTATVVSGTKEFNFSCFASVSLVKNSTSKVSNPTVSVTAFVLVKKHVHLFQLNLSGTLCHTLVWALRADSAQIFLPAVVWVWGMLGVWHSRTMLIL